MIQGREEFSFALETCQAVRVTCKRIGQHFDSDITPELGIPRAVDFTHPTRTDRSLYFVGADPRATC